MKYIFQLSLLFVFTSAWSQRQSGNIKGYISNANGTLHESVSIKIKGTAWGTITNGRGEFEINNVNEGDYVLVISSTGFENKEVPVQVERDKTTVVPSVILSESSHQLDEIIVTASKSYKEDIGSQSLRINTPLIQLAQNVQIISKQVLADQQIFDMLEGVTRNVSGAQRIEHWDNYALINMRGSQVTAFRNGMNVQMPWGPLAEDVSMVERIEFVKGPAGFMLANGEPSGFYNVVTKKPSGNTKGEANVTIGSFNTYRAALDLDGKLSNDGKLLYRFNVMGQQKGSHRQFEFNNRYSIVPVIQYKFSEKTSLTLEYTQQFSQMSVIGSNYIFSAKGYGDLPVDATTAESNLKPTNINDKSLLVILQHKLNSNWNMTAQGAHFNYNQIGQSLWPSWQSGISDTGDLQRSISIWDALGISTNGQVFVSGEEKTGAFKHRILAGLDANHKDYFADWSQTALLGGLFNIYNPVYGTVTASDLPTYDRSKSIRERGVRYNQSTTGLYFQNEIGWMDKIRLTLAIRFTKATTMDPYSGNSNDKKFTPRLGLSYSLNENTSLYALYDQAFLPSPGKDFNKKNFDPITGNNIELGFKRNWSNSTWNSALSSYRITKNNVLVTDPDHPLFSKQIGQTQTQGIEADVRGEVVKNLSVVLNYALTDSKVTKDPNEENVGNRVAGSSKHITNGWLNYKISHGSLQGLKVSVGYQWQIDRTSWSWGAKGDKQLPDYFRLDGAISWSNPTFNVGLNVNNILNAYLYSGSPYDLNSDGKTEYYWQTEAPLNFRLSVGCKF